MNSTGSFLNLKKEITKKNQNDWIHSEWYKEWEQLAHKERDDRIIPDGYWCYDNKDNTYKYIKIL